MTAKIPLMIVAGVLVAGCAKDKPTDNSAPMKQQLQQLEASWNQAYAARDANALAAIYADDAAIANPGEPLVLGKQRIQQATAGYASDPNLKVAFSANRIQVSKSGDLAYTRGQYTLTMSNDSGKPEMSTGHYLTVWQRQADGNWKAIEDFVTPGAPQKVQGATAIL